MSPKPTFRRRKFLIKRGLQFRYIGIIFALALLASIVTGYTVFTTGWTLLGEKLSNVYPQGRLVDVFRATNLALIKNLLFISPIVFVLGLLFSHKIAGPVYRIEKSLYEISNGNLTLKIKLRNGDELWGLADIINTMTGNIDISIESNKGTVLNIQKGLDEIKKITSSQSCDPKLLQSLLANLETYVKDMNSSLAKWITTPIS